MMKKTVRFYELRAERKIGNGLRTDPVANDFWLKMATHLESLPAARRQIKIRGRTIHGESRIGQQPATRYFYLGGVRERAEWPQSLSGATGVVGELEPQDRDAVLVEPTYVVPFGDSNQIAMLTMSASSPRVTALESWFSAMLDDDGPVHNYTLIPVINSKVSERLANARGATILRVKVQPDADIPETGGGKIGTAARAAKQVSTETDIELGWTLGRRAGHDDTKAALLEGARWVREDFAKSATVNLELPDGDGFKRAEYDLIKEQFTAIQKFDIRADESPKELSVLTGINEAIARFRKEFS